jgi:hypothetical protein
LVAPVAARWFDGGEVVEIEIEVDDGSKSFSGDGVTQSLGQGVGLGGIFGL